MDYKDKRLQKSKLLELGKYKQPKNQESNQIQQSMTSNELKAFENSISAFGSNMPTANSAAYNPVVEE